jgi:hypothetical protein
LDAELQVGHNLSDLYTPFAGREAGVVDPGGLVPQHVLQGIECVSSCVPWPPRRERVDAAGGQAGADNAGRATQSDGVVDQTGIESAMEELRVQYVVHKGVSIAGPTIETATHWIVMSFSDSLDKALPDCVRTAIGWLTEHGGLDRRDAYALCSMAVSFRVTQWADQTGSVYSATPPRTIHAMIPKAVFGERVTMRVERSMRPS